MPSPFPGMDPYLEGHLWPDVHQRLATQISRQLTPYLRPRYVARLAITIVEETDLEAEIGIMYPDVEVMTSTLREAQLPYSATQESFLVAEARPEIAPPLTIPAVEFLEIRLVRVEIRDLALNQLVTSIEVLSPVNKRGAGLEKYRLKRRRLHQAGVHLLEIDLLRRGSRPIFHSRLPKTPYLVMLTRAYAGSTGVWPIQLPDKLPTVPVPLLKEDPDVPLDLSLALAAIYDEAAYDLSIDYRQPPPPPPLSEEEAAWVKGLLEKREHGSGEATD
ncbi:MAG: DUF4058 family protein [Chloroflexota bacterium]